MIILVDRWLICAQSRMGSEPRPSWRAKLLAVSYTLPRTRTYRGCKKSEKGAKYPYRISGVGVQNKLGYLARGCQKPGSQISYDAGANSELDRFAEQRISILLGHHRNGPIRLYQSAPLVLFPGVAYSTPDQVPTGTRRHDGKRTQSPMPCQWCDKRNWSGKRGWWRRNAFVCEGKLLEVQMESASVVFSALDSLRLHQCCLLRGWPFLPTGGDTCVSECVPLIIQCCQSIGLGLIP